MSKALYVNCPSLHSLPKCVLRTKNISVGNGQYAAMLFVIPVVVTLHKHGFKMYIFVSVIYDNMDMVIEINRRNNSYQRIMFTFL